MDQRCCRSKTCVFICFKRPNYDYEYELVAVQCSTGKTLSFVIPIVQELQSVRPKLQRSDGVHAIVLVPTRELALQCLEVFQSLVKPFLWLVPGAVMGGEKKKSEKARLRKGLTVLVATPGRLLDHIENTSTMTLSGVRWLILDEADRLLDMGFEKDIAAIVTALNAQQVDGATSRRQTVLLSATLTAGVHRMAGMSLRDPEQVFVGADAPVRAEPASSSTATGSEGFTLPDQLGQEFVIVPSKLRLVTLTAFILSKCKLAKAGKLLVFLSTQDSVDFHYKLLDGILNHSAGGATTALPDDVGDTDASASSLLPKISEDDEVKFFRLHGSMTQMERTDVFNQYKMAMTGVLLSTDVAARGLDMRNISWVVQYDPPGAPANYIHRIGRTARIGSSGQALLFLTPAEVKYVTVLNNHNISLNELQCAKILQCLLGEVTWLHSRKKSDIPRTPEEAATRLMMVMENYVLLNSEMHDIARKAYASSVRGYATHPSSLKHIFHVRNLHLGHVAKSFGLREAPKAVGHTTSKSHTKLSKKPKRKRLHIEAGKSRPRPSGLQMSDANRVPIGRSSNSVSEFGSGLSDRGKSSKSLAPKAVHKVGSKVVKDRKAIAGRRVYMKKQVGKSSTKKIKSASLTAG
ncbi:PREDICTED: probable ATP-dependent RNA helicase DDX31 [Priapulus caudatus]|uniref:ATP-dependent RNA helicase n=1 Tax=Priapulus caudatus TaxID=37621 RepID=A0ABM1DWI7_PRICU|nr:PREDICTED: probable ATP-dependent RNA helicase DDX31 [Priapulus caudatus]